MEPNTLQGKLPRVDRARLSLTPRVLHSLHAPPRILRERLCKLHDIAHTVKEKLLEGLSE